MWYEKLQKLKWEDGVVILGLGLLVAGVGMNLKNSLATKESARLVKNDVQVDSEVVIDVGGEVLKPGVYKLAPGARVNDGLAAAGGLSANADRDWVEAKLNKADLLKDGQKIYIPSKKSETLNTKEENSKQEKEEEGSSLISLNMGTAEDLDKLPGVGPATAKKIIDYREKNGGFRNVEEIKLVSGIGDKMYGEIKDLISL